ncbi:Matrin-3, partial [Frankliniella fusca]
MTAKILVQHYVGHISGEENLQRICVQCITAVHNNPVWSVADPSFTQYECLVPLRYLEWEPLFQCGCCLDPCFIVLQRGPSAGELGPLEGVEQVPPPQVAYPGGFGVPEQLNDAAIVAELDL